MLNIKRRSCAALAIAAAFVATPLWAQQTLKIGAINPYSGPMALYGNEVTRGYELAVDQVNAAGGLLGRKVELVRGDASIRVTCFSRPRGVASSPFSAAVIRSRSGAAFHRKNDSRSALPMELRR